MNSTRRIALLLVTAVIAVGVFADEVPAPPLTKVDADKVCMVNEQFMNRPQIPVVVEEKTYYGCCAMCKERLAKDESKRHAIDPVSGKKVDKAKAVIGAAEDGRVAYFENEKNFAKYNAAAKK